MAIPGAPTLTLTVVAHAQLDWLQRTLQHNCTEAMYRTFRDSAILSASTVPLPARLWTLKQQVFRLFRDLISIVSLDTPALLRDRIPWVPARDLTKFWLWHPETSAALFSSNQAHTWPFLDSLAEEIAARRERFSNSEIQEEVELSEAWDGLAWLESLVSSKEHWWPIWEKHQRGECYLLFIHDLVFPDGFDPVQKNSVRDSMFVFTQTAGEFSHRLRSKPTAPTIVPRSVMSKEQQQSGKPSLQQKIKREYRQQFIDFEPYGFHNGKPVYVVNVHQGTLGDLPGRGEFHDHFMAQFANSGCHYCMRQHAEFVQCAREEEGMAGQFNDPRARGAETKSIVEMLDSVSPGLREAYAVQIGIHRRNEYWDVPGLPLLWNRLIMDLMHLLHEGEGKKAVLTVVVALDVYHKEQKDGVNVWREWSAFCKNYARRNQAADSIGQFENENHWKYTLGAHDKFVSLLCLPLALGHRVPPVQQEIWGWLLQFVRAVRDIWKHTITLADAREFSLSLAQSLLGLHHASGGTFTFTINSHMASHYFLNTCMHSNLRGLSTYVYEHQIRLLKTLVRRNTNGKQLPEAILKTFLVRMLTDALLSPQSFVSDTASGVGPVTSHTSMVVPGTGERHVDLHSNVTIEGTRYNQGCFFSDSSGQLSELVSIITHEGTDRILLRVQWYTLVAWQASSGLPLYQYLGGEPIFTHACGPHVDTMIVEHDGADHICAIYTHD